jgi:hypothetical protein
MSARLLSADSPRRGRPQKVADRCGTQRAQYAYHCSIIIGVILFAVLGIGLAVAHIIKRQWLRAIATLLGAVGVEVRYASMAYHQPWLSIASTILVVAGAALAWRAVPREARKAEQQQSG